MIETQGGDSFQGGAGTSLQKVSRELSGQLSRLLAGLNTMAQNVRKANAALGAADVDVSRQISQVGGRNAPGGEGIIDVLRGK
jgi:hypothetical protein